MTSPEMPGLDLAKTFAEIALDVNSQDGVDNTRARIIDLAQKTLNCRLAVVWHLNPSGSMKVDAASDPELGDRLEMITIKLQQGVAWQCLHDRRTVTCTDLSVETRWPQYCEALLATTPIRSAVGYSLHLDTADLGALVLYADSAGHFTPDMVELGGVFAAHCALALDDAFHSDKASNLAVALATNRRIGMAIGILMGEHKLSEQHAFDVMRTSSQRQHVKLHDVAEGVILTGAMPTWPAKVEHD
ncbi:GAF and ANTAR domain-containing protein [Jatrophihabitans telluris]|uniref:GAF and ANTAR domain-containing protein n=1 Tax=Jatrophihabitans telluris TaxID=2038343 RepID=A0ABY4R1L5_9ACTN|nr:GAF and ANTAR domain-containing protein [Jatrophihabitans telluris]UQX89166.1 GAF and ANTAR domain-containing protein [Jatrophihabitans telluris]